MQIYTATAEAMRVASDGTLIVNSGANSIVGDGTADELVVRVASGTNGGITIASGGADYGVLNFGDAADGNAGHVRYNHNTSYMELAAAGVIHMNVAGTGVVGIHEVSNAQMDLGLTIKGVDAAGTDAHVFALKADTTSNGFTDFIETDTFMSIAPIVDDGGVYLRAFRGSGGGASHALNLDGVLGETPDSTDTTGSAGVINFRSYKTNGAATSTGVTGSENAFSLQSGGTTYVLFKADGTVHAADTSWATALDDMPDAIAARAYTTERGLLSGYQIHAPALVQRMEDAGIVTHAELPGEGFKTGHRFLNVQKGIKFSWDMGFQNLKWLHEVTKVLTKKQRKQLPAEMQSAFAYLEN